MRLALAAALLLAAAPLRAAAFDAAAAWNEFAAALRDDYAYFQRPGVDGAAILARFAPAARAAPDAAALRAVMKTAARNFADPHLIVGPLGPDDPPVVPTASDMAAAFRDGAAVLTAVREGGAAAAQDLAAGDAVRSIDGQTPAEAVARLLGRPFAELSPAQADHGLAIALAGRWKTARAVTVMRDGRTRRLTLRPTSDQSLARPPLLTTARRDGLCVIRIGNSLGDMALIPAFDAALDAMLGCPALLLDLRNTPSGGNTTVARAIMGRFVAADAPYQMHRIPAEQRRFGVERQWVEWVRPRGTRFAGSLHVAAGRWTGSMGEGLVIGFDAFGARTLGSAMGRLLGAVENRALPQSGAKLDYAEEALFHVDGTPRAAFVPRIKVDPAEATAAGDPVLDAVLADLRAPAAAPSSR